jgi:hypothetical protein
VCVWRGCPRTTFRTGLWSRSRWLRGCGSCNATAASSVVVSASVSLYHSSLSLLRDSPPPSSLRPQPRPPRLIEAWQRRCAPAVLPFERKDVLWRHLLKMRAFVSSTEVEVRPSLSLCLSLRLSVPLSPHLALCCWLGAAGRGSLHHPLLRRSGGLLWLHIVGPLHPRRRRQGRLLLGEYAHGQLRCPRTRPPADLLTQARVHSGRRFSRSRGCRTRTSGPARRNTPTWRPRRSPKPSICGGSAGSTRGRASACRTKRCSSARRRWRRS